MTNGFIGKLVNHGQGHKSGFTPLAETITSYKISDSFISLNVVGGERVYNNFMSDYSPTEANGLKGKITHKILMCGEIYNTPQLCTELRVKHDRTNPVFLASLIGLLFEKFGVNFASKINGMFSLVIWDSNKNILYMYVDRYGAAFPVFYCDQRELIFGSQLKFLLNCTDVKREIDQLGLALFLKYSYIPLIVITILNRWVSLIMLANQSVLKNIFNFLKVLSI